MTVAAITRSGAAALAVLGLTACAGRAHNGGGPGNPACRLVTVAHAVRIAGFPDQVNEVDGQSRSDSGYAICTLADEASANTMFMSLSTPSFLRSRHLSARKAATLGASGCADGTERQPDGDLGTVGFFCLQDGGAARGAWVKDSVVLTLSVASPSFATHSDDDRLRQVEAIARAISAKVRSSGT